MKKEIKDVKEVKSKKSKKKIAIIIGSIVALVLIAIVIWWLFFRKIEVTLDYNNNSKDETIFVKVNKTMNKKDIKDKKELGDKFIGWFEVVEVKKGKEILAKKAFNFENKITKKIKLNAVYSGEVETITVRFESNGGSKVEDIILNKGVELKLPKDPTRDGYTFGCWKDKNEIPIGNGALLADDITLYAYWDEVKKEEPKKEEPKKEEPKKEEQKKEEQKKEESKKEEPKKDNSKKEESPKAPEPNVQPSVSKPVTYKCEDGYTLNDTKCVKSTAIRRQCPSGYISISVSQCAKITYSDRVDSQKACPSKVVNVGNGHTETVQGKLIYAGTHFCYYGEVKTIDENNESTCRNRGHKWSSVENKCYYDMDKEYSNTCNTGYKYIGDPNQYSGINGLNGGCYPVKSKAITCPDGYKLTRNSRGYVCKIEKDAIVVE